MPEPLTLLDRYLDLFATEDIHGVLALYAPDAEIVSFGSVSRTHDERHAWLTRRRGRTSTFSVVTIDQVRTTNRVVLWEATIEVDEGVAQVAESFVLDDDGRIAIHLAIALRYWGR
ncbi:MAG: nuclear transport factor 2 family protein [Actinomycetota bacterium]